MDREFAGALLRPHASSLPRLERMGISVEDVYEATRDAGQQLVQEGRIADRTLDTVSREIVPREEYVPVVNANFQRALDALERPQS